MPPEPGPTGRTDRGNEPYAWYVLGVLLLVYVLNFVDRQLLAILAPELKRDLGISDSDFGFLYGTAFGVFYAVFGIPLGKLADRWSRVRLLGLGLALWSAMTALSGGTRNFAQLAAARIGVGVGEATLSPCAYSLIGDYFPPRRRATALGIYSAGLYIGGGLSLLIGSTIVDWWDATFPLGTAPMGLTGWQAAFLSVGIPGIAVAAWVSSLREPARGQFDTVDNADQGEATENSWRGFVRDLLDVLPPLTIWGAAQRGGAALLVNLLVAVDIALASTVLARSTGDVAQWAAFGAGCYAIFSWVSALRHRDRDAFATLIRSRAFMGVTVGYSLLSFVGYANIGFAPLYAIQQLGAERAEAGFMLGSLGALAGTLGVVGGGILADRIAGAHAHHRRVALTLVTALGTLAGHALMFTVTTLPVFYAAVFVTTIVMSATLGGSSGTVVNIVPAHLRGTAAAAFLLGTNMIGLALGPYAAGKMSTVFGDLGAGLLSLLILLPAMTIAFIIAWRALAKRT